MFQLKWPDTGATYCTSQRGCVKKFIEIQSVGTVPLNFEKDKNYSKTFKEDTKITHMAAYTKESSDGPRELEEVD